MTSRLIARGSVHTLEQFSRAELMAGARRVVNDSVEPPQRRRRDRYLAVAGGLIRGWQLCAARIEHSGALLLCAQVRRLVTL